MKRPAQVVSSRSLPRISQPGQPRRLTILRAANDNAPPLGARLRVFAAVGSLTLFFVLLLLSV